MVKRKKAKRSKPQAFIEFKTADGNLYLFLLKSHSLAVNGVIQMMGVNYAIMQMGNGTRVNIGEVYK